MPLPRGDCSRGCPCPPSSLLDRTITHVLHDADDFGAGVVEAALSEGDLLPDWILTGEERARGGLVDHDDLRLPFPSRW